MQAPLCIQAVFKRGSIKDSTRMSYIHEMKQMQEERKLHLRRSLIEKISMMSNPTEFQDVRATAGFAGAHSNAISVNSTKTKQPGQQEQEEWEDHPYGSLYKDVLLPRSTPGTRVSGDTSARPMLRVVSLDPSKNEPLISLPQTPVDSVVRRSFFNMPLSTATREKQDSILTTRLRTFIQDDLSSTRSPITIRASEKSAKAAPQIDNHDNARQSILEEDLAWMNMYRRLVVYTNENGGSTLVPSHYEKDPSLGRWVADQRFSSLNNPKRRQLLDAIYFCWDVRKEREQAAWMDMFKRLVTYKVKNNGSTLVPRDFVDCDGRKIGRWADDQRKCMRINKLSRIRTDFLESIGFEWHPRRANEDIAWIEMFERLRSYARMNHGSTAVPQVYNKDPKLGQWVSGQRKLRKNGKLALDRLYLLNSIDFCWERSRRNRNSKKDNSENPLLCSTRQANTTHTPNRGTWPQLNPSHHNGGV